MIILSCLVSENIFHVNCVNCVRLSVHTITNIKPLWNPLIRFVILKKSFLKLWRYLLSYILNECLLSINPFYDTSQVLIMIWLSVHRIMTINFIGCVITLVIPSSLAMFTFKKIYLKFYLLCLVEVSLNPPSPPQKKSMQKSNTFLYYFMLCKINRLGSIILPG